MSTQSPACCADLSLDRVFSHASDGIFVLDRDRGYILFNTACERITGHRAEEVLGRRCTCADILRCEDEHGRPLAGILCPARSLFDGQRETARQRMRIHRPDGSAAWLETVYTPILDPDGRVEYVLGVVRDASETKAREEQLIEKLGRLRDQLRRVGEEQKARYGFDNILSRCQNMTPVFEKVRAALRNAAAVLISGEPGTGRETLARTIHNHGLQAEGPFVALDCAALPQALVEAELFGYGAGAFPGAVQAYPGALRAAEGGTLFLAELGEMPLETQARLLRAMQERRIRPVGGTEAHPIDARLIAAISQAPRDAVARGKLREDLYYRLSVIAVALPPLRQRRADIPFLVQSLVDQFNQTHLRQVREIDADAWLALDAYHWPGNIRELANAVEAAFATGEGPVLRKSDLPPHVQGIGTESPAADAEALRLDPFLERIEREAIQRALQAANWQRSKAASLMGISRSRLYRRMEALNIDPNERW